MSRTIALRSGALRHKAEIYQRVLEQDEFGEEDETWSKLNDVWVHIRPLTAREIFTSQGLFAEVTHLITARYSNEITAANRLDYNSEQYEIKGVLNVDTRNKKIELMASTGVVQEHG